jgi:hypothetical protein
MRKNFTLLAALFLLFVPLTKLIAQNLPDTIRPITSGERKLNDYRRLQEHFFSTEQGFAREDAHVYLYSVKHQLKNFPDLDPKFFRLTYENILMLNTHNFTIGMNPWTYEPDKFNAFLSGRVGWGYNNSNLFLRDSLNNNSKILSTIGIEGELEKQVAFNNFNLFAGIGINFVNPQKFITTSGAEEKNSGTILDPFFGARYYFVPGMDAQNKISLQVKVGFPFTNGFAHIDGDASSFYVGFGAGITSLQSFSRKSEMGFMSLESGVFISPTSGTVYGQFIQPIKVLDNLSIGINGIVGTGYTEAENNNQRVSSLWGFGADLRFFAYRHTTFLNPYIGLMRNNYGFNIANQRLKGAVNYLKIGDRIQLGSNSNWFLDFHIAVPFNVDEDWINYTDVKYDTVSSNALKNYIKSIDSLTLNIPTNIDVNIGLVYKFKTPEERRRGTYIAKYDIFAEEHKARLEKQIIDPTPIDADADEITEHRIYLKKTVDTYEIPLTRIYAPNVDASDVKMIKFSYQAKTTIDKISHDLFNVKPQPSNSVVLLLAMFDRERNNVDEINNQNMQLVFTNLKNGKYFGFNYDLNKRIQPDPATFEEFVKPLRWLDIDNIELEFSAIEGKQIENDLLRYFEQFNEQLLKEADEKGIQAFPVTKNNYRFAYVLYPEETLKEIADSSQNNFAASINFRYDLNFNHNDDNGLFGHFKLEGDQWVIDKNDASYYSNLILGKDIFPSDDYGQSPEQRPINYTDCNQEITIDNFILGSDKLSEPQKTMVLNAARLSVNCDISLVIGYTDKVEFFKNIEFMEAFQAMENNRINRFSPTMMQEWNSINALWSEIRDNDPKATPSDELCQRALAWKRVRTVVEELDRYDIDISNISISAKGVIDGQSGDFYDPSARKVVIKFQRR